MGMPVRHLVLSPRAPWSWLSPRLTLGGRLALPAAQRMAFAPPWPSLAIGCGRSAALLTRLLRRLTEGYCHTAQILDPRIDLMHWDTVIAPKHDGLVGPTVLNPLGSLNPVDEAWLADGREASPALDYLPRPRVGVLLGGPRAGIRIDVEYAQRLVEHLLARRQREGGSLLVLASRRTPMGVAELLRNALRGVPGLLWTGPDDGSNPYPGVLGWADRLVVTPDSVNMLSEACAVGCDVHTFVAETLPPKLARFHGSLRQAGLLYDIDEDASARQVPLRETAFIAEALRKRILARQT
ncbi:nucleoside-diphosphate sugar epimerase [Dyella choica]|uniref:Nucleoside-diphosphate sugar epimerase n=2 Tax=Dyella choica TaxID=1927959 RepID=A0A3S0S7L0_9GAMM|nr:nucleoside-diphosphate sugar epimerase [Dyella choica]